MLREALRMELGGQYAGGNARMVEKVTRCRGEEFLYVGDHIFTDVNMAKRCLSWRTCMILQARNSGHLGPTGVLGPRASGPRLKPRATGLRAWEHLAHGPGQFLLGPNGPSGPCRSL